MPRRRNAGGPFVQNAAKWRIRKLYYGNGRFFKSFFPIHGSATNTAKFIIDIMTKHTELTTNFITDKRTAFTSTLVDKTVQSLIKKLNMRQLNTSSQSAK